jgi:hypothetical protein
MLPAQKTELLDRVQAVIRPSGAWHPRDCIAGSGHVPISDGRTAKIAEFVGKWAVRQASRPLVPSVCLALLPGTLPPRSITPNWASTLLYRHWQRGERVFGMSPFREPVPYGPDRFRTTTPQRGY